MGSTLSKRLAFIRDQATDDSGRISFRSAFIKMAIAFVIISWSLSYIFSSQASLPPDEPLDEAVASISVPALSQRIDQPSEMEWERSTRIVVQERTAWLQDSWISFGGAEAYLSFANKVAESFDVTTQVSDVNEIDIFTAFGLFISRVVVSMLLRLAFIVLAGWPFWILGAVGGLFYFRTYMRPTPTRDVLGVCDRKRGPFYSGIYGKFRPNNSGSGTEFSCPGLACPAQATLSVATEHNLTKILKHYEALNKTTLDLVRIVLAYGDLPAIVDEERIVDDDPDAPAVAQSISPIKTNKEGTLEKSALEGLLAILAAHQVLRKYYNQYAPVSPDPAKEEELFGTHRDKLQKAAAKLNPLARTLLSCLSPARGRAVAVLSPALVAAAYLATEAGKSLVYRREGTAYIQISRYPHLQARAVLQSLLSYHEEYTGDERLMIRQAILCSRRHGDFGRTFLPSNMGISSRALRDFLEILYWHPKKRSDIGPVVEIDAHLEEIHTNWRDKLGHELAGHRKSEATFASELWKGIPYKSVVLFPLEDLVRIALSGLSSTRISRVMELAEETRNLQALMNISARLPGFKRQTVEAEKDELQSGGITRELAEKNSTDLVPRWLIVRRMLTRYNWLSTRVGDDNVPVDGLVKGIVIERPDLRNGLKGSAIHGLEAAVPIRQRRFREFFGARWEQQYYSTAPHPNAVEVWVDADLYREKLLQRQTQAKQGVFDRPAAQAATS